MSGERPVPQPTVKVIEVWQEPNRRWRWHYLEPSRDGQPLTFQSNKEYDSREAALRRATIAPPGVVVLAPGAAGPDRRVLTRGRLLLLGLLTLVVLVLWPRRRRFQTSPGFEHDRQGH
jgi:hypothetical protein